MGSLYTKLCAVEAWMCFNCVPQGLSLWLVFLRGGGTFRRWEVVGAIGGVG